MRSILIVDDEDDITSSLKLIFESQGFIVRTANSGNEALKAIMQKTPDLLLTDAQMPDGNGFTLIMEIRRKGILIPIILMSAQKLILNEIENQGLRISSFLQKPFEVDILLDLIRRLHS